MDDHAKAPADDKARMPRPKKHTQEARWHVEMALNQVHHTNSYIGSASAVLIDTGIALAGVGLVVLGSALATLSDVALARWATIAMASLALSLFFGILALRRRRNCLHHHGEASHAIFLTRLKQGGFDMPPGEHRSLEALESARRASEKQAGRWAGDRATWTQFMLLGFGYAVFLLPLVWRAWFGSANFA